MFFHFSIDFGILVIQFVQNKAQILYRRALEINLVERRTLNNLAQLLIETNQGVPKRLLESMALS